VDRLYQIKRVERADDIKTSGDVTEDMYASRCTNIREYRKTNGKMDKQTDRKTNGWTDKQTDRWTERQTDRHSHLTK
jgi:hypothetical protein